MVLIGLSLNLILEILEISENKWICDHVSELHGFIIEITEKVWNRNLIFGGEYSQFSGNKVGVDAIYEWELISRHYDL